MLQKMTRYLLAILFSAATLFGQETPADANATTEPAAPATEAPEPVAQLADVPESELIEMVGYLTALGGGIGSLQLDADEVDALATGFVQGLEGSVDIMEIPREDMEAAFAQAQARAEAAQSGAEELPAITADALNKIGAVIVLQSGLSDMGFTAENAPMMRQGFVAGASESELDPAMEAKMEAFQAFIQPRAEKAQAAAMAAQQAEMAAQQAAMAAQQAEAMAEFKDIAEAWVEKDPMTVVFETTQGKVEIELMPSVAPLAVANFVGHVEAGYYDGLIFHRVIPDFMIQGGDPQGTGAGGESIWGKSFPDEFSPEVRFDKEGLLAMANSGPMTNGSQFFITTSKPEWLNDKHTIFGTVTSGYDVVEKIEGVETAAGDKPVEAQKIVKAYVK